MTMTINEDVDRFARGEPVDRHDLYRRLRHDAPLVRSEALGAWVLSRHADVKAVLEDEDRFASLKDGPGAPVYGPSILQWRGREHQKKGGIVARRLRSPMAVSASDEFVQRTASDLADRAVAMDGIIDLKVEYSMWLPLLVIGELLDVDGAERFRDWYRDIASGGVSSIGRPEVRERAFAALEQLAEFLRPIIEERRMAPGDDILSDLCTSTYEGEQLPFEQILSMTAFLLTAGVETTERALSSLFVYLFEDPARWQELRDHPELVTAACAETLRVFPPVHGLTRSALEDVEIHGVTIPKGDRFLILIGSANRDEEVFERADEFDLRRFEEHPERQFTNAGWTMPFGAGRHHCTGSQLARLEMEHGLRELLQRVEGATFEGATPPPAGFLLVSPDEVRVRLKVA
jgi:cytochrome P450